MRTTRYRRGHTSSQPAPWPGVPGALRRAHPLRPRTVVPVEPTVHPAPDEACLRPVARDGDGTPVDWAEVARVVLSGAQSPEALVVTLEPCA